MRVEPFALPLSAPLSTAADTVDRREGFVVRLGADETPVGTPGVGEATPLPGWTEAREDCRAALDRAGEADGPGAALAAADGAPAARHGVALAAADARARSRGEPLYRTLGGEGAVASVPVNATVGDGAPDETAGEAAAAVRAGFGCLKVKVGARPLEEDLARIAMAGDAVGEEVALRLDANGAWSREEAERAFEALAPHGIAYVEQPLAAADLEGHAALRARHPDVGVALDESVVEAGVDAVLRAGAADAVVLKPMALGGPDRARAAARRARDAGVAAVVTTTVDAVHARTAAVHLAASLAPVPPCGLATADRLAEDLADDPAPVEDGRIRVPQGPGNLGDTGGER